MKPAGAAAVLIAGAAAGVFAGSFFFRRDRVPPEVVARIDELIREKGRLLDELASLLGAAEKLQARLDAMEKPAGGTEAPPAAERGEEAAPRPAALAATSAKPELPYRLASADEADTIYQDAVARGDLEALWTLAAVLLSMGEPGYEKAIALFEQFSKTAEGDEPFRQWMRDPLVIGRFVRAAADHHEDFLRFALHLKDKDPEKLPKPVRSIQKEFLHSEERNILLGFFDGADQGIRDGYLDVIESDAEKAISAGNEGDLSIALRGLAQLRGERATDILLGLTPRVPEKHLDLLALALGYQGNPRALVTLKTLRARATDSRLQQVIDSAIRLLE